MNKLTVVALGGMAAAITLSACAAMNRTRPGDMTVPEHEQAAAAEGKKAEEAAKRATSVGRGSEYERYSAVRHHELAKEHSAAAERRRGEVATACEGVNVSTPFASMRVERVEAIREADVSRERQNGRGHYPERLKGARVAVSTLDDASPAPAARSIECEGARASAGLDPASGASPLAVRTAKPSVRPADSTLVVEIRSADQEDAAEILRRAEAMAAAPQRLR
jgi:hypothetical protein